MDSGQFRDHIIVPALRNEIGAKREALNTPPAIQLLQLTAGIESECGQYVVQVDGPALGPYQMEPDTLDDLYTDFLAYRVGTLSPTRRALPKRMVYDFHYATQVARLQYYRHPYPLPALNDKAGMWHYYKTVWNTVKGAATQDEFRRAWKRHVEPLKWGAA